MSTDYQTAIAYSHNFATAKPDILPTEKEHILGLCQTLESVGEDRDRFSRMFSQACETLGAVQEALGEESSTELTGFEPQLVKKTKEERDALAARYTALADEVRAMIQDSDGLAGYHLNGDVACWSEFDVGHLLSEPGEVGGKVIARLKAEGAEAVRDRLREKANVSRKQDDSDFYNRCANVADHKADDLRRQAAGGDT